METDTHGMRSSPTRRRRRWRRGLEIGLWGFGMVCLAWVGWSLTDSHMYRQAASAHLAAIAENGASSSPKRGGASPRNGLGDVEEIASGTPLATLNIPRLGLSTIVAEGTTRPVLRRAVGRLPGGARLGEPDNVVLAGHRISHFRELGGIQIGDSILLDHSGVTESYVVEWVRVVGPKQMEVARGTDYPALTLVTCYPFRYVGPAPERFVVRARRAEGGAVPVAGEQIAGAGRSSSCAPRCPGPTLSAAVPAS